MARIAVVGLGKVGLPFACHMIGLGHEVAGCDKNADITKSVACGGNPFPWEDLGTDLPKVPGDLGKVLEGARVAFVVVPTPQDGDFLSPNLVANAVEEIDAHASPELRAIVVVSTLDPRMKQSNGAYPGWLKGLRFPIVYSPPLIRLGTVRADLKAAKILFLGGDDPAAMRLVEQTYYPDGVPSWVSVIQGDYVSIAAAKMAINATLSARTAWANDVASRAHAVGANPDVVLSAVRADPRIGSSCMYAGPPPGGPCLPRDMAVWSSISGNGSYGLVDMTMKVHEETAKKIVQRASRWIYEHGNGDGSKVAILGVTYNPKGLDVTNSIGLALWRHQRSMGRAVRLHDPAYAFIPLLPGGDEGFLVEADVKSVVDWADVVVVGTLWDEYRIQQPWGDKPRLVIDWRGK